MWKRSIFMPCSVDMNISVKLQRTYLKVLTPLKQQSLSVPGERLNLKPHHIVSKMNIYAKQWHPITQVAVTLLYSWIFLSQWLISHPLVLFSRRDSEQHETLAGEINDITAYFIPPAVCGGLLGNFMSKSFDVCHKAGHTLWLACGRRDFGCDLDKRGAAT